MYQNFMDRLENFSFDAFASSLASRSECVIENKFSYYWTKSYAVGTQKNPEWDGSFEHPKQMFKKTDG